MWRSALAVVVLAACNGGKGEIGSGTGVVDDPTGCVEEFEIAYDGIDQDCDGEDLIDIDGDGEPGLSGGGLDCDDEDPDVYPGAFDQVGDGIDTSCDGVDGTDSDGDGFPAFDGGGDDCNDADSGVFPMASDTVGDGVDQNCDGADGVDADGDGYGSRSSGGLDCDDSDPAFSPDAEEIWYDGLDQNCDQYCDYDQDGDEAVTGISLLSIQNNTPCDFTAGPTVLTVEDCDDENSLVGQILVVDTVPESSASNRVHVTEVSIELNEVMGALTIEVEGPNGVVSGAGSWDGNVYTYAFAELPGGDYEVTADWGCDSHTWSFQTVEVGDPVDTNALVNRTWSFDLGDGDYVEPPGVGALLGTLIQAEILLHSYDADGDNLDLLVAVPDFTGAQEECLPTGELSIDFTANPFLNTQGVDISIDVAGFTVDVTDAIIEGVFTADGSAILDLVLAASLDTRPMVPLILPGGADDAVCDLISAFGVSCIACPDGTGDFCLNVEVENLEATEVSIPVVPRTDADIDADPNCP